MRRLGYNELLKLNAERKEKGMIRGVYACSFYSQNSYCTRCEIIHYGKTKTHCVECGYPLRVKPRRRKQRSNLDLENRPLVRY